MLKAENMDLHKHDVLVRTTQRIL